MSHCKPTNKALTIYLRDAADFELLQGTAMINGGGQADHMAKSNVAQQTQPTNESVVVLTTQVSNHPIRV